MVETAFVFLVVIMVTIPLAIINYWINSMRAELKTKLDGIGERLRDIEQTLASGKN